MFHYVGFHFQYGLLIAFENVFARKAAHDIWSLSVLKGMSHRFTFLLCFLLVLLLFVDLLSKGRRTLGCMRFYFLRLIFFYIRYVINQITCEIATVCTLPVTHMNKEWRPIIRNARCWGNRRKPFTYRCTPASPRYLSLQARIPWKRLPQSGPGRHTVQMFCFNSKMSKCYKTLIF